MGKLVFCEDDAMIQALIRAALRSTGHELFVAGSATEGLELIRRERPSVVFTDVWMPGMDGYQLAAKVRADPLTAHIPIVFMTASVERSRLEEAQQHGATSILSKPFSMSELRQLVAELTSGR